MKGNKRSTKQTKTSEPEKSTARVVVTIVILIALILSAYFFIFKKEEAVEKPKAENNILKEKPSEKSIRDSVRKNDSLKIVNKEYVGNYSSERDPANFRELFSDGSFKYKDGIASGGGTYQIDSTVITFNYDVGMVAGSLIVDNKIIDSDKEVWIKKK
ncbi:MAG: hypothetical protein M3R36_05855 [Bacteroidota bacterium]|nr:hypothetical protein [Bacteroidota bacterium]